MPIVHSQNRGDMHVVIKVVTPTSLTPRQKELLREFAEIEKQQNERAAASSIASERFSVIKD